MLNMLMIIVCGTVASHSPKKIWMSETLIAWQDRMSDHHFWPPHFCVYLSFFVMYTNSRQSVKWFLIGQITCACNIC